MTTHADMSPETKARVDAGAQLGRKLAEYAQAFALHRQNDISERYLRCKRSEYDAALERLIEATIEERAAK